MPLSTGNTTPGGTTPGASTTTRRASGCCTGACMPRSGITTTGRNTCSAGRPTAPRANPVCWRRGRPMPSWPGATTPAASRPGRPTTARTASRWTRRKTAMPGTRRPGTTRVSCWRSTTGTQTAARTSMRTAMPERSGSTTRTGRRRSIASGWTARAGKRCTRASTRKRGTSGTRRGEPSAPRCGAWTGNPAASGARRPTPCWSAPTTRPGTSSRKRISTPRGTPWPAAAAMPG